MPLKTMRELLSTVRQRSEPPREWPRMDPASEEFRAVAGSKSGKVTMPRLPSYVARRRGIYTSPRPDIVPRQSTPTPPQVSVPPVSLPTQEELQTTARVQLGEMIETTRAQAEMPPMPIPVARRGGTGGAGTRLHRLIEAQSTLHELDAQISAIEDNMPEGGFEWEDPRSVQLRDLRRQRGQVLGTIPRSTALATRPPLDEEVLYLPQQARYAGYMRPDDSVAQIMSIIPDGERSGFERGVVDLLYAGLQYVRDRFETNVNFSPNSLTARIMQGFVVAGSTAIQSVDVGFGYLGLMLSSASAAVKHTFSYIRNEPERLREEASDQFRDAIRNYIPKIERYVNTVDALFDWARGEPTAMAERRAQFQYPDGITEIPQWGLTERGVRVNSIVYASSLMNEGNEAGAEVFIRGLVEDEDGDAAWQWFVDTRNGPERARAAVGEQVQRLERLATQEHAEQVLMGVSPRALAEAMRGASPEEIAAVEHGDFPDRLLELYSSAAGFFAQEALTTEVQNEFAELATLVGDWRLSYHPLMHYDPAGGYRFSYELEDGYERFVADNFAISAFVVQNNRMPSRYEMEHLTRLNVDPWLEFGMEVVLDPLNLIPAAAFEKILGWTKRGFSFAFRLAGEALTEMAPGASRVLNDFFHGAAVRSGAARLGARANNTFGPIARHSTSTAEFADEVGRVVSGLVDADEARRFGIGRHTMDSLMNAETGILEAAGLDADGLRAVIEQASIAVGNNVEQLARLSGLSDEAVAAMVREAIADPNNVVPEIARMLEAQFIQARTVRIVGGERFLNEGMIGALYRATRPAALMDAVEEILHGYPELVREVNVRRLVDDILKGADLARYRLPDAVLEAIVVARTRPLVSQPVRWLARLQRGYGEFMRYWTTLILRARPSFVIYNMLDNMARAVISDAPFDSLETILKNLHEMGSFLPEELRSVISNTMIGGRSLESLISAGDVPSTTAGWFRLGFREGIAPPGWKPLRPIRGAIAGLGAVWGANETLWRSRLYYRYFTADIRGVLRTLNTRMATRIAETGLSEAGQEVLESLRVLASARSTGLGTADPSKMMEVLELLEGGWTRGRVPVFLNGAQFDELAEMLGEPGAREFVARLQEQVVGLVSGGMRGEDLIRGVDEMIDGIVAAFEETLERTRATRTVLREAAGDGGPPRFDRTQQGDGVVFEHTDDGELIQRPVDPAQVAWDRLDENQRLASQQNLIPIYHAEGSAEEALGRWYATDIRTIGVENSQVAYVTREQWDEAVSRSERQLRQGRAGVADDQVEQLELLGEAPNLTEDQLIIRQPNTGLFAEGDIEWLPPGTPPPASRSWATRPEGPSVRVVREEGGVRVVTEVSENPNYVYHWTNEEGIRGIEASDFIEGGSSFSTTLELPFDVDNDVPFGVVYRRNVVENAGYTTGSGTTALEKRYELSHGDPDSQIFNEAIEGFVVRTEEDRTALQGLLSGTTFEDMPIEVVGPPGYQMLDRLAEVVPTSPAVVEGPLWSRPVAERPQHLTTPPERHLARSNSLLSDELFESGVNSVSDPTLREVVRGELIQMRTEILAGEPGTQIARTTSTYPDWHSRLGFSKRGAGALGVRNEAGELTRRGAGLLGEIEAMLDGLADRSRSSGMPMRTRIGNAVHENLLNGVSDGLYPRPPNPLYVALMGGDAEEAILASRSFWGSATFDDILRTYADMAEVSIEDARRVFHPLGAEDWAQIEREALAEVEEWERVLDSFADPERMSQAIDDAVEESRAAAQAVEGEAPAPEPIQLELIPDQPSSADNAREIYRAHNVDPLIDGAEQTFDQQVSEAIGPGAVDRERGIRSSLSGRAREAGEAAATASAEMWQSFENWVKRIGEHPQAPEVAQFLATYYSNMDRFFRMGEYRNWLLRFPLGARFGNGRRAAWRRFYEVVADGYRAQETFIRGILSLADEELIALATRAEGGMFTPLEILTEAGYDITLDETTRALVSVSHRSGLFDTSLNGGMFNEEWLRSIGAPGPLEEGLYEWFHSPYSRYNPVTGAVIGDAVPFPSGPRGAAGAVQEPLLEARRELRRPIVDESLLTPQQRLERTEWRALVGGERGLSLPIDRSDIGMQLGETRSFEEAADIMRRRIFRATARGDYETAKELALRLADLSDTWQTTLVNASRQLGIDVTPAVMRYRFPAVYMMDPGTLTYLRRVASAQDSLDRFREWATRYKGFFRAQVEAGNPMLRALTPIELQQVSTLGREMIDLMIAGERAAMLGGEFLGQQITGALPRTNRVMINYQDFTPFDQMMKGAVPFWMFPSRSLPFWLETMAVHPEIASFYIKYLEATERATWQAGFVTSDGEALPSMRGLVRVADGVWINPLAPWSGRYVFPAPNRYSDERITDISFGRGLMNMILRSMTMFGASPGPWIPMLFGKQGFNLIDPESYQVRGLIPQGQLIPPFAMNAIRRFMRQEEYGFIFTSALDILDPDVSFQDFLIARQVLINAQSDMDTMTMEQKRALIALAEQTISPVIRRDNPEAQAYWDRASNDLEMDNYWSAVAGYAVGFYFRPNTDALARFIEARNDIAIMRYTLNNDIAATLFEVPIDYEQRHNFVINNTYEVPENYLLTLYGSFAWTQVPYGSEPIRDNESPQDYYERTRGPSNVMQDTLGESRDAIVAHSIEMQRQRREYLEERRTIIDETIAQVEALPIGTHSSIRRAIWKEYGDRVGLLELAYPLAGRDWVVGYKPESLVYEDFRNLWWNAVVATSPPHDPDRESYQDWRARYEEWESTLVEIAIPMMRGMRNRFDGTNFMDPSLNFPEDLTARLVLETNPEGLRQWRLDNDSLYEAMSLVWTENFWNKWWEMMDRSTNTYSRELIQRNFNEMFPGPNNQPTVEQFMEWMKATYGDRFSEQEVRNAYFGSGALNVEQRLKQSAAQDVGEQAAEQDDRLFELLTYIPPGDAQNALRDEFRRLGGDEDWFTLLMDTESTAYWRNQDEVPEFERILRQALRNMGHTQPTDEQLREFTQARDEQDIFRAQVEQRLGEDIWQDQAYYYGLSSTERRELRERDPALYQRIQAYYEMQDEFATTHPVWAKYYNPDATAPATGTGGGGVRRVSRGTGGGGARTTAASLQYIPLGYRGVSEGRELLKSGKKLGAGGAGGKLTWPPGFKAKAGSTLVGEIEGLASGESGLSASAEQFLKTLKLSPEFTAFVTYVEGLNDDYALRHPVK